MIDILKKWVNMMARLKAVLIDDNKLNLSLMQNYTNRLNLEVQSYDDPVKALKEVRSSEPDIIYVDYLMPIMNGIEFISAFRKQNTKTPVIMITGVDDDDNIKLNALKAGATEFILKPINYIEFYLRSSNLLRLKQYQNMIDQKTLILEQEVKKEAGEIVSSERETLFVLAKTTDYKDPDTGMHIKRVAHYSKLLAEFIQSDSNFVDMIYYCAPLHDVGKVGIPDKILQKHGKLTAGEFRIMKKHTLIGYDILDKTRSKYLEMGKIIAISHHEKYDGTGYPYGLAGVGIPVEGRIVAVADVLDALLSKRSYKRAWGFYEAIDYITSQKGKHFDPMMVDALTNHIDEFKNIFEKYNDDPNSIDRKNA